MLDSVTLPAFGKTVPLASVAQVSVRDAQTLWVAIFDPQVQVALLVSVAVNARPLTACNRPRHLGVGVVQLLEPAATAIRNAGLGLNPVTDKNALRVPIPKYGR